MKQFLLIIFVSLVSFLSAQMVEDTNSVRSSMPTVNLSIEEIESESDEAASDISSLLQGSKDPFANTAGYTFGSTARFRIRGYGNEESEIYINGINLNDSESGRVFYGIWGGLNDALRNKEFNNGLTLSNYSFGGIGGSSYITTRASKYRKNIGTSYAISNRSYRNRIMLTYNTGLMNNGWALAFTGSKRWAQEGYQEGTFYDAYAYFLSIEKQFNSKHSIGLTAFGSPNKRGKGGGSVQEAYDLTGNNYYNPNWGYQNGKKRNSRVANGHQPHIILSHYYTPNEKTTVTTSASYAFGHYKGTALNWYNTRDPRPDYYRYLPSYYDDKTAALYAKEAFLNNHQLNWDYYYKINQNSTDGRASYIVEERRTDYSKASVNTIVNHQITDILLLDGGLSYSNYKGRHYVVVDDLLGADYYLDVDKFGERDFPNEPNMYDNDLTNSNKIRKEGDVISYDYDINQSKYQLWGQLSGKLDLLDFYASLRTMYNSFWRTGHMKNGKFPENSYGDSPKQNFLTYESKAGGTYKINGRNYLSASAYYGTRAPQIRNSFISPRTRDYTVEGLKKEHVMSGEINYNLKTPYIKARITGYYTKFYDQTQVFSFFNDLHHSYTNQVITGIDKQNMGLEIGVEKKINSSFTGTFVTALGQNTFTNRPRGLVLQDNDAVQLAEPYTIYQKNFYQSGPQNAYALSIKYTNPHYWFVSITASYYQNNYLSFDPTRRTIRAIKNESGTIVVPENSDMYKKIINQEHLKDAFILNVFGRKTWKKKGFYIYLNAGINNILNNQDFITGGYEQRRFTYIKKSIDDINVDKFPPKYFYSYGVNYFISLGFWY